jgi:predicted MFS family arabinose efflux permease
MQSMELGMAFANRTLACPPAARPSISGPMVLVFAGATGVISVNVFASQTLIGPIGAALGLGDAAAGLVSMATLLGYATGLFLLVPLADLVENRPLLVTMLAVGAAAAAAAALTSAASAFLAALFVLGAACSANQILLPMAASMAPPERRGGVVGDVASGIMIGIVLSRPLASFIAGVANWRAFYVTNALALGLLVAVLACVLPRRRPQLHAGYVALLGSLWHLLRSEPVLRQRALTASLVMAAFSVFWTTIALQLAAPPFHLDQRGIALFALAGASGAFAAPITGRAGDRGWVRATTALCHVTVVAAFGLAAWCGAFSAASPLTLLAAMAVSAVLLDFGVIGDQTLGRRAVNLLRPEARGRLNALFVGLFFLGGAVGSAVTGLAWAHGGWSLVCAAGAAFGVLSLLVDWLGART